MTFELLNVRPEIVRALKEEGIEIPTLIQEKAIPLIKEGKDVIGMSKTGSGKTAAFGVPLLENITPGKGLQILIMAPTRELAVQISTELRKFGRYMRCNITTVFGGVSIGPQIDKLTRADIVVGTPGRLLDHLQRRTLDLSRLKCAVLDEADKMVEMGFIEDINKILNQTPKDKQMLLFGATIAGEIKQLKQRHMKEATFAEAEKHVKEDYLQQYYYNVEPYEKFSLLMHLLKKEETKRAIIFCSTISTVEMVARNLRKQNADVDMLHGKLSQNRRLKVMENFNKGKFSVLVASPVAARGLDIKDVSHIFNYDLSQDPQEYIHRVGRTARAGEQGKAITLLCPKNHDTFRQILSTHDVNIEVLPREDFPRIKFDAGKRHGGFGRQQFSRGPRRHGWSNSNRHRRPRHRFGRVAN